MERLTRRRAGTVILLFVLVLGFFALKLYDLQIIETGGQIDNTTYYTTKTTVRSARGEILDRNGNVLVTNRASYDLVFNHYVICSAENRNQILLNLVKLCRELDAEYTDHFPITADAPFSYTLSDITPAWQGYFQNYLAIKPEVDSDITAALLMRTLREYYNIPEEWSDKDARAVIGLRYELDLRNGVVPSLSSFVFMEDVDSHTLSALLELNVPGLRTEASVVRVYTTAYASHILGYVGAMDADQWSHYKELTYEYENKKGEIEKRPLYNMDSEVGQSGLEEVFEEYLHGIDGVRVDVTATDGTIVESYYTVEPKAGQNVELSIDLNVQSTAEDSMNELITSLRAEGGDGSDAEGGAVVVLNVKTGEILACASFPTYDLSTFRDDYNSLLETDFAPLYNRALQAAYPPGSTYKMSMVIAAIDSGVINQYTEIFDDGVYREYEESGFTPKCLHYTKHGYGHGWMNSMTALEKSCNLYFYWLGDNTDINIMDTTAKLLGLGELSGAELAEEDGHRANPTTKAELHKGDDRRWYAADQLMAAIGQSDNRFTPMQLCMYTATLANRGVRYKATFLSRVITSDYTSVVTESKPEILSTLEISDEAYAAYSEGMKLVAKSGTAATYFKNYPIEIAAKTGTAETDSGGSDNGAFVCYAPFDDPEIAVVVYGEKAGHGSTMAQIGKSILDCYFADELYGDTTIGENELG